MSQLSALSISIAILGGLATWAFLAVGGISIWAAFLAWGCFFHTGGDSAALRNTIVGNLFGVVCAWAAAVVILAFPLAETLSLPLWAGIVVGVSVWVVCFAANIKALAVIPASVYGYAATFAFLLQTPGKLALDKLTAASLENALIVVPVSMVIGAALGFVSAKVGMAMTASEQGA